MSVSFLPEAFFRNISPKSRVTQPQMLTWKYRVFSHFPPEMLRMFDRLESKQRGRSVCGHETMFRQSRIACEEKAANADAAFLKAYRRCMIMEAHKSMVSRTTP